MRYRNTEDRYDEDSFPTENGMPNWLDKELRNNKPIRLGGDDSMRNCGKSGGSKQGSTGKGGTGGK